ncbi:superoxide dismutase [Helicobacter didelphidarum]|uniref:Superoxide dismutase n=1 Tax=Helicobacter didelphidarum TaxID=2040648 RepID=A0A3D8IQT8_9HELI|nr:superoxide dismutase [Helicobacter didelphidarum]RDU67473.1 superoxide dismutase [Helicobacter didelphidarum]
MFELRKLPYEKDSMKDFLTIETFEYHYGKHHNTYVANLNNLIKGGEFENAELYDIIKKSSGGLFNNAAQVYNHDFYWDCITPSSSALSQELQDAITAEFGSLEGFKEKFLQAATTLFGAGWCWLVYNPANHKLEIVQTSNAATPVTEDKIPLLVVDVWEHAYYIDHRNARPVYLEKFFAHIHWAFVSKAYEWAKKEGTKSIRFYMNEIHKK